MRPNPPCFSDSKGFPTLGAQMSLRCHLTSFVNGRSIEFSMLPKPPCFSDSKGFPTLGAQMSLRCHFTSFVNGRSIEFSMLPKPPCFSDSKGFPTLGAPTCGVDKNSRYATKEANNLQTSLRFALPNTPFVLCYAVVPA